MVQLKKYSGAGNTFFIVNGDLTPWSGLTSTQRSVFVNKICTAFSVDGFLFLHSKKKHYYEWDFFNRDGSGAEMCGNAARCAMAFVGEDLEKLTSEVKIEFDTRAGLIEARKEKDSFKVRMPEYKVFEQKADVAGFSGLWVDTGVPHFVVNLPEYEKYREHKNVASQLRSHSYFTSRGTNVTFFKEESADTIRAVTFERGVEDFTLACGTGAVAAAVFQRLFNNKNKVSVKMPGGDIQVEFTAGSNIPTMSGQAKKTEEIEISIEDYL